MTEQTATFTYEEWETLKQGPVWILHQVAGADSHVDTAEWTALIDAVAAGARADERLVRNVMTALGAELHANAQRLPGSYAPLDGLREIAAIVDRAIPVEAPSFKATLLEIGATLAEASGAQLVRTFKANHGTDGWAWRSGTSAVETQALGAAAQALGLAVPLAAE